MDHSYERKMSFDMHEDVASGHVYLFQWLYQRWNDSETAKHIVWQFAIFYALLLVGFGFLYMMIRSTGELRSKIRELRKDVTSLIKEQRARKFDLDDYSKMGSAGYL